tara:strand:- start:198 stop:452 length:255 start_codon:yes stop_codon:yes gene_type:complete
VSDYLKDSGFYADWSFYEYSSDEDRVKIIKKMLKDPRFIEDERRLLSGEVDWKNTMVEIDIKNYNKLMQRLDLSTTKEEKNDEN